MIIYKIILNPEEKAILTDWVSKGSRKAKDIQKAYVLLASDEPKRNSLSSYLPLIHSNYKASQKKVL